MSVYVIGHLTVKDEAKWAEYRSKVPATLEPWGAEVMFRGSLNAVFCGDHSFRNTVVIRFPDAAKAEGWYKSPAYQALIPLRNEAADMVLLSFDT